MKPLQIQNEVRLAAGAKLILALVSLWVLMLGQPTETAFGRGAGGQERLLTSSATRLLTSSPTGMVQVAEISIAQDSGSTGSQQASHPAKPQLYAAYWSLLMLAFLLMLLVAVLAANRRYLLQLNRAGDGRQRSDRASGRGRPDVFHGGRAEPDGEDG
jgi:hypothetical protein